MKYAIDTEFIDTPTCSALISLAIVCEDGREKYFEFEYPTYAVTPWLESNVIPYLSGQKHTFSRAADILRGFIDDKPEFWAYYGAYDFFWFCRVFGGFMEFPREWGILTYHDFAHVSKTVDILPGEQVHNALSDARSLMAAMRYHAIV